MATQYKAQIVSADHATRLILKTKTQMQESQTKRFHENVQQAEENRLKQKNEKNKQSIPELLEGLAHQKIEVNNARKTEKLILAADDKITRTFAEKNTKTIVTIKS